MIDPAKAQPITIIQTPHINNINNYHNYNINTMSFNQEFDNIGGTLGGGMFSIGNSSSIPANKSPMIMLNPQLLMMGDDPALA